MPGGAEAISTDQRKLDPTGSVTDTRPRRPVELIALHMKTVRTHVARPLFQGPDACEKLRTAGRRIARKLRRVKPEGPPLSEALNRAIQRARPLKIRRVVQHVSVNVREEDLAAGGGRSNEAERPIDRGL